MSYCSNAEEITAATTATSMNFSMFDFAKSILSSLPTTNEVPLTSSFLPISLQGNAAANMLDPLRAISELLLFHQTLKSELLHLKHLSSQEEI